MEGGVNSPLTLSSNAVQHGRADTPIKVLLRGLAHEAIFEVCNEADVIPPAKLRTLFDPVKRFAIRPASECAASQNHHQNLGLGLYVVTQIVAAHEGDVSVMSNENDGVVFTARLPRLQPHRREGE